MIFSSELEELSEGEEVLLLVYSELLEEAYPDSLEEDVSLALLPPEMESERISVNDSELTLDQDDEP